MKSIQAMAAVGVFSALLLGCNTKTEAESVSDIKSAAKEVMAHGKSKKGNADLAEVKANITAVWQAARPGVIINDIEASEVPGIYKITMGSGPALYSNADGSNFIVGDLYRVKDGRIVNVTEESRNGERAEAVASIDSKDMITFAAKGEKKKTIYVFTDVDCYYCQKLHNNMAKMNEMGIEVNYLAYPRAGIGSNSYNKIASAWCAKDRMGAMTKLKNRQEIPINVCEKNPVGDQFLLGQQIGLTGTPALVLESGELIAGFLEPAALASRIGLN